MANMPSSFGFLPIVSKWEEMFMGIKAIDFAKKVEVAFAEKWGYIWATAGEQWTTAKQKELEKKYKSDPNKYADYKQGAEYGSKWIGHRVSDCSGLAKKFLNDLGIKGIYHGSNSQFNKNCVKTGPIKAGVKIPIGALIFTGNAVGQHNHVGVLTTETCVTEAKGTTAGVVHTPISNKKWTYWGLVKGLEYDFIPGEDKKPEPVKKPAVTKKHTTLRRGAKGEEVVELQTKLSKDGSTLAIDGIFGIGTLSAVKSFQKRHDLVVDGIVGPKTWAELDKIK